MRPRLRGRVSRWASQPARRWARHALTVAAVLAAVLVAVGGIADQLAGRSVLADTDAMVGHGPYAGAGWAGTTSANLELSDVFSSELPAEILYAESVAAGHPAQWDPYTVGGTPLGSITNNALLSPATVPYYVLPVWLAPAYERLAEVVLGLSGCFLFLRRLRLSPPSAIAGGIVYAASAFTVVWLGWPQTRVAAFIPMLFWATERFLQERRFRDAALLGVVTAGLLLGGFPSVEGYALLTVSCYALVRLLALYRDSWRRLLRVGAGLGFGYLAGLGLALFQVLPFAAFYRSWLIEGRGQADTSHLNPVSLVTSFAPWAFGGVGTREPQIYLLDQNAVESLGYVGAASLVVVLVGVVAARRGRALLPRGVWVFFVAATALWLDLVYRGGVLLRVLQHLPVLHSLFGANFIGRARSMTGFLLACLAAVGFELVLRGRAGRAGSASAASGGDVDAGVGAVAVAGRSGWRRWYGPAWPAFVLVVVGVEAVRLIAHGHSLAVAAGSASSGPGTSAVAVYDHEVRVGLLIGAIAVACVGLVGWIGRRGWSGRRWAAARFAAAAAVLFLIAGQGAQFIYRYSPQSDRSTFYPVTDTQEYLAAHLGGQRYASTVDGVVQGIDSVYKLRSLHGHSFLNAALVSMVRGIPDDPVPLPTHLAFGDDLAQATSPVLDRLGVSYFAAAPQEKVFGSAVPAASDGSVLTLQPGVAVTAQLPASGRLRAVGFTPTGTAPAALSTADPNSWVEVMVRDATGTEVASAKRLTAGMASGTEFDVPVAADSVPAGTALTATITVHASAAVVVQASGGGTSVALSEVAGADDGLRLDYAGSTVLYQRLTALPRIRWASGVRVVPDEAERVKLLASGSLPSSTVVLNSARAGSRTAAAGLPADVTVTDDGTDSISATVSAQGGGYLVVADADQVGWSVTVDGKAADLVPADQGVVAVAVPSGRHTVRMAYSSPDGGVGGVVSEMTVIVLLGGVGIELWRVRRVRGRPSEASGAWSGPADLATAELSDNELVPTAVRGTP
jgi:hypothetical protein